MTYDSHQHVTVPRERTNARARGNAMAHRFLLLCASNAGHELVEIVDTQRSSCIRYALTDSSFSFGDLGSRGNGVEVES